MKFKMKKKILLIFLVIVLLLFLYQFLYAILRENESWITDNEFLYDKAITYLEDEENEYLKDEKLENYKVFIDYEEFGITESDNKKYAYMWILMETYYIKDDDIQIYSESSMAYKFTFKNNEVIRYKVPKDGNKYISSVKDMFPDSIENKILKFQMDHSKLERQVKEYYNK